MGTLVGFVAASTWMRRNMPRLYRVQRCYNYCDADKRQCSLQMVWRELSVPVDVVLVPSGAEFYMALNQLPYDRLEPLISRYLGTREDDGPTALMRPLRLAKT